jgi:hypothetical protein
MCVCVLVFVDMSYVFECTCLHVSRFSAAALADGTAVTGDVADAKAVAKTLEQQVFTSKAKLDNIRAQHKRAFKQLPKLRKLLKRARAARKAAKINAVKATKALKRARATKRNWASKVKKAKKTLARYAACTHPMSWIMHAINSDYVCFLLD